MNDSTWTWISGSDSNNYLAVYGEKGHPNSSNIPGGREDATGWYDCTSQELWVFGGYGYESLRGKESGDIRGMFILLKLSNNQSIRNHLTGPLNDLWRYRVNDSTWTWISGNNTVYQPSIYGEKGVTNSNNHPGARNSPLGLYDSLRQVFWLFGGHGTGYGSCPTI